MPRGIPGSGTTGASNPAGVAKKLIAMLNSATQEDLDLIDAQIEDSKAQIKGLESLRECLAERVLNSPSIAAKPRSKPNAPVIGTRATIDEMRLKVARFLRFQGPTTPISIKRQFDLEQEEADEILADPMFSKEGKIWKLTAEGDAAIERAKAS